MTNHGPESHDPQEPNKQNGDRPPRKRRRGGRGGRGRGKPAEGRSGGPPPAAHPEHTGREPPVSDWLDDLDHDLLDDHGDDQAAAPPPPQKRREAPPAGGRREGNRPPPPPRKRGDEPRRSEARQSEGRQSEPRQNEARQSEPRSGGARSSEPRPAARSGEARRSDSDEIQSQRSEVRSDESEQGEQPPREGRQGDRPQSARPRSEGRRSEGQRSEGQRSEGQRSEGQRSEGQSSGGRRSEGRSSSGEGRSERPPRRDRKSGGRPQHGDRPRGDQLSDHPGFADDFDDDDEGQQRPPRPRVERTEKTFTGGFSKLGLSPEMMEALAVAGYEEPTPIQAGLVPRALAGVDVLGQARTGTGKTAAFVLPILEKLSAHHAHAAPQALVLVPTRELAVQVKDEFEKLAEGRRASILAVYGGKPIRQQVERLKRGVEVVVGTPGRVLDHLARGTLQTGDLKLVVLDEADRMLDIGFRPDIEKILRQCPQSRQTLLLSATVPPPVEKLAKRYMRDPETMNFSPTDVSADTIDQYYFTVDADKKFDLLLRLIARENPTQSIIFCRTKRGTEKILHHLQKRVSAAACIHGDLSQNVRDRVMAAFRDGRVKHLVATDVVGRGIDVTNISHIINYDVPAFCDDYVHRVGRTGRMGREGVAYTFVTPEEGGELTRIEIRIDKLLKRDEIEGFETTSKRARDDMEAVQAAAQAASTKYITSDVGAAPEAPEGGPPKQPPKKKYRRAL